MSVHSASPVPPEPARDDVRTVARTLGTIASVWAHPDDETYLAGGIMAAARDLDQQVVVVTATAGERGTDDPTTWPPERLRRRRVREARAAMAVLGVADHRVLGLPDGGLDHIDDAVGAAIVGGVLEAIRPDTVLTFGLDGITGHPDHIAVGRWVALAVERLRPRPRVLHAALSTRHLGRFGPHYEAWGVWMSDERPRGVAPEDLAIDVELDGDDLDRKVTALEAMASQTVASIAALGRELFVSEAAAEAFVDVR